MLDLDPILFHLIRNMMKELIIYGPDKSQYDCLLFIQLKLDRFSNVQNICSISFVKRVENGIDTTDSFPQNNF